MRQIVMSMLVYCAVAWAPSSLLAEQPADVGKVAVTAAEEGVPTCNLAPATRLDGKIVFIVPGEVVCVRLERKGSIATPVELVGSRETGDVLILKSWASAGVDTFLTVHNPFDSNLKYRAGLLIPGEEQFRATSSCTVLSERFSLEHWPHSIAALALTDFRLSPKGDESVVCE